MITEIAQFKNNTNNYSRSNRLLTDKQRNNFTLKNDIVNPCILFSDVVNSSKQWADNQNLMVKKLDKHFKLVDYLSSKYNAWIVKTIGDAFMIYFNPNSKSLTNAINYSKELIKLEQNFDLRIGVCRGGVIEDNYEIQDCYLKDFFGNTVNVASRMESKVAEDPNYLAFTVMDEFKDIPNIDMEEIDLSNYDLNGIKTMNDIAYKINLNYDNIN